MAEKKKGNEKGPTTKSEKKHDDSAHGIDPLPEFKPQYLPSVGNRNAQRRVTQQQMANTRRLTNKLDVLDKRQEVISKQTDKETRAIRQELEALEASYMSAQMRKLPIQEQKKKSKQPRSRYYSSNT